MSAISPEIELFNIISKHSREFDPATFGKMLNDFKTIIQSNPNLISSIGHKLLLQALDYEYLDIALFLLGQQVNPWLTNEYKLNALHMLTMVHGNNDKNRIAKILEIFNILKNTKEFNEEKNKLAGQEGYYRSALMMAIGHAPIELTLALKAANVEALGDCFFWEQMLLVLPKQDLDCPPMPIPKEILDTLLKNFADQFEKKKLMEKAVNSNNYNAVQLAVERGQIDFLKYCQRTFTNEEFLSIINPKAGISTLQICLKQQPLNKDMILYLLENGADRTLKYANKTFDERLQELTKLGSDPKKISQEIIEILTSQSNRSSGPKF